jgi:hypothetical protein
VQQVSRVSSLETKLSVNESGAGGPPRDRFVADSAVEEAGFEPSVPRYGELGWRAVSLDIRRGMSLAEKVGEFGAIHLARGHREGVVVDRAEAACVTVDRHVVGRVGEQTESLRKE